jgi:trimethylamine:corrinoid methyltransferase-like protein
MPSAVIDRGSIRTWQQMGKNDTLTRAKNQLDDLLGAYQPPVLPSDQVMALRSMVERLARDAGIDQLPKIG